jgi:hypothetical protein
MAVTAVAVCGASPLAADDVSATAGTHAAPAAKESAAADALAKLGVPMHKDPAGAVRWIEAVNGELTDEAMALLPSLPALEWLEVGGGKVTPAGVAHLKDCTALKRLYIHDVALGGDGLEWLGRLDKLEALSLQRTGVGAAVLKNVKAPNLTVLNLSGNPVKDDALEYAAGIKGLEVLSLADTQVTGAGLQKLRGMARLNELNLMRCSVYDQDIDVFLTMPNLRIVYAAGSSVSGYGVQDVVMRFPTLAIFIN